ALGLVKCFPSSQELDRVIEDGFPVEAVNYLGEHPVPGPLFNEYFWGGYIIHTLVARQRVFIDGRADVYEHGGIHSDYLRIIGLDRDTLWLLRKYGIASCLIRRATPLATLLGALPEWKQVYADDVSVVFTRLEDQGDGSRKAARSTPSVNEQHQGAAWLLARSTPAASFAF